MNAPEGSWGNQSEESDQWIVHSARRNSIVSSGLEVSLRGNPTSNYCWQDNELYDIFQPIIGPYCVNVYVNLSRKAYGPKVTYTIRGLASASSLSTTTVWRSLEVLKQIGLVRLKIMGGNRTNECELFSVKELAKSLGAKQTGNSSRWVIPAETSQRLKTEVQSLKVKMAGKRGPTLESPANFAKNPTLDGEGTLSAPVAWRNASVSLEKRQRHTSDTQGGVHLLIQDTRLQNDPTPTPSQRKEKTEHCDSTGDDSDALLKCSRNQFNGLMNDLSDHLLNTSAPTRTKLANGYADWEEFGFRSLAVEAVARSDGQLALVLSADDPAAARRGLEKYHQKWNASLRKWFACEVTVDLQEASGGHEPQWTRKG